MKRILKNIPFSTSGVALGFSGLGLLVEPYNKYLKYVCAIISLILIFIVTLKLCLDTKNIKKEFSHPFVKSISPIYLMTFILLASYLVNTKLKTAAKIFWLIFVVLDLLLTTYLIIDIFRNFKTQIIYSSWCVTFTGIGTIGITSKAFNMIKLGEVCFWIGVIFYVPLIFVLAYRLYIHKGMEKTMAPTIAIITSPGGLLIAAMYKVYDKPLLSGTIAFLIISQLIYFFVIAQIPYMLKHGISFAFSSFTFPFITTATALNATFVYYDKINFYIPTFFRSLLEFEKILATLSTFGVLIVYIYLVIKNTKEQLDLEKYNLD